MDGNPLFGFHDLNVCNSKYLFQNRIPAINKNGFTTIGFKFKRKNVSINAIEKPSEDEWNRVIKMIEDNYGESVVIEDLWKAYESGESLADVNAITFARLSFRLGLKAIFFRYSDIIDSFEEEWNKIVPKIGRRMYWYRCECGGMTSEDRCPICGGRNFLYPVPNAVLRHLIFFEGLKTSVFVSGLGGLNYGKIADNMAKELGLNRPKTVCWICNDLYLSRIRKKALKDLMGMFKLKDFGKGSMIEIERKREAMNDVGKYRYSKTLIEITRKVFELKPSMIDLIESVGMNRIVQEWRNALKNVKTKIDGNFVVLRGDVDYDGCSHIFEELIGCSNEL